MSHPSEIRRDPAADPIQSPSSAHPAIPEELLQRWRVVQPARCTKRPDHFGRPEVDWAIAGDHGPVRVHLDRSFSHELLTLIVKEELAARVPYYSLEWAAGHGWRAIARRTTDPADEPLLGAHELEGVALLQVLVDLLKSRS